MWFMSMRGLRFPLGGKDVLRLRYDLNDGEENIKKIGGGLSG